MKQILILFVFFIFFVYLYNFNIVKAQSSNNPSQIISTNFSKSIEYFFKNTTDDLVKYYREKFAFYEEVSKNLTEKVSVINIYSSVVNYLYSNLFNLQKNVSNYIKLITPGEQK